jgi:hypothetical protein
MARVVVRLPRLSPVLCVAAMASVGTLSADVLTPFVQTTCTLNGAAEPCQVGLPVTGAGAFWTVTGLGTPSIDVLVDAGVGTDSNSGLNSATASITLDFFESTAGSGPGFVDFEVQVGGETADATIGGLGSCFAPGPCNFTKSHVPITLGVPFEIKLDALADAAFMFDGEAGGSSLAEITLNAVDASGAPVSILAPTSVPEPSGLGLLAAALLGAGVLLRRREG